MTLENLSAEDIAENYTLEEIEALFESVAKDETSLKARKAKIQAALDEKAGPKISELRKKFPEGKIDFKDGAVEVGQTTKPSVSLDLEKLTAAINVRPDLIETLDIKFSAKMSEAKFSKASDEIKELVKTARKRVVSPEKITIKKVG